MIGKVSPGSRSVDCFNSHGQIRRIAFSLGSENSMVEPLEKKLYKIIFGYQSQGGGIDRYGIIKIERE